ncbi:hypothetical protein J7K18_00160 [bacterium]|nr:hypothetical protein [bacterium]
MDKELSIAASILACSYNLIRGFSKIDKPGGRDFIINRRSVWEDFRAFYKMLLEAQEDVESFLSDY